MRAPTRRRKNVNDVILILSQDTGGVCQYLTQTFQDNSVDGGVSVQVRGLGVSSKTMFDLAKRSLAGRDTADVPAAKYVFLVFDRDSDHHFNSVLARANGTANMEAVPSIPCFEYFFILHFEEVRPAMGGPNDALVYLRRFDGFSRYEKGKNGVPIARLAPHIGDARARCQRIRAECASDGSGGPQTMVDHLFSAIEIARAGGLAELIRTKPNRVFEQ